MRLSAPLLALSLADVIAALEVGAKSTGEVTPLLDRFRDRANAAEKYIDAYRRYCWPVRSLDDLKLAPFHLLATEGKVHTDRDHVWHMQTLRRLCDSSEGLLLATSYMVVDVTDPASQEMGVQCLRRYRINIFGTYLATRADAMKDWTGANCQVKSVSVNDGFASALSPTVELLTRKGAADGTCGGQEIGGTDIWGVSIYVKEGDAWKFAFGMNLAAM